MSFGKDGRRRGVARGILQLVDRLISEKLRSDIAPAFESFGPGDVFVSVEGDILLQALHGECREKEDEKEKGGARRLFLFLLLLLPRPRWWWWWWWWWWW